MGGTKFFLMISPFHFTFSGLLSARAEKYKSLEKIVNQETCLEINKNDLNVSHSSGSSIRAEWRHCLSLLRSEGNGNGQSRTPRLCHYLLHRRVVRPAPRLCKAKSSMQIHGLFVGGLGGPGGPLQFEAQQRKCKAERAMQQWPAMPNITQGQQ